MEMRVLQAELRAIVQGPKNAERWGALLALLMPFYDALRYLRVGDDEAALRAALAQLEEEVLPGLKQELERSWPAELRVVLARHPLGIKALGGMLHIDLHPHVLSSLLYQHGHKGSGKLTRSALKVLPALCLEGLSFEGVRIENLREQHVAWMEALLDAAPDGLRHVRLRDVAPTQDSAALREMVELLLARCGPQLESYAASVTLYPQDLRALDALYRPLIEQASSLTALRQLELPRIVTGDVRRADGPDTVSDILHAPGFVRLEALRAPGGLSAEHGAMLCARPGSRDLRRIALGLTEGDISSLMDAPSLAGVEVWDVSQRALADDGWETPAAAHWAAMRRPASPDQVLDAALVDLRRYDAARAEALLFEGSRLRPAPRVEALRLEAIGEAALVRLCEQAASAWPGLKCLVVLRELSDAELSALVAGGLLERLAAVDWRGDRRVPGVHLPYLSPYRAQVNERLKVLACAMDAATHPILGYGLLQQVLATGKLGRASQERLARAMGMSKPYPAELPAAMRARFFAVRGAQYAAPARGVVQMYEEVFAWSPAGG
jgi:hypothetical protein